MRDETPTGFGPPAVSASQKHTDRQRAVLVGVDISSRAAVRRPGAEGARAAAWPLPLNPMKQMTSRMTYSSLSPSSGYGLSTSLSVDASLVEFRELVRVPCRGAVVAQVLQRRSRADAATLIGAGKVEEIAGIAAANDGSDHLRPRSFTYTVAQSGISTSVFGFRSYTVDSGLFARHARTAKGSCRSNWRNLSTCFRASLGGVKPCPSWAAALERVDLAKPNLRRIAAAFNAGWIT